MRTGELLNVCDVVQLDLKTAFFKDLTLGRAAEIFAIFRPTTWAIPEVICTCLAMTDQKDATVVFDNDASGNSMFHAECPNGCQKQ